jgi:hypothetical protein
LLPAEDDRRQGGLWEEASLAVGDAAIGQAMEGGQGVADGVAVPVLLPIAVADAGAGVAVLIGKAEGGCQVWADAEGLGELIGSGGLRHEAQGRQRDAAADEECFHGIMNCR